MKIGPILLAYRQKHDISQKALAAEIGIDCGTLCRIESMEVECQSDKIVKLLAWLISK